MCFKDDFDRNYTYNMGFKIWLNLFIRDFVARPACSREPVVASREIRATSLKL